MSRGISKGFQTYVVMKLHAYRVLPISMVCVVKTTETTCFRLTGAEGIEKLENLHLGYG